VLYDQPGRGTIEPQAEKQKEKSGPLITPKGRKCRPQQTYESNQISTPIR
jgi:hypothetical protein